MIAPFAFLKLTQKSIERTATIYNMKGGVRKKKYVGNHPLRVAEARQKLQNYKDRMSYILTQEKVRADLDEIEAVIHHLLGICSRFDLVARFALQEEQNGDK